MLRAAIAVTVTVAAVGVVGSSVNGKGDGREGEVVVGGGADMVPNELPKKPRESEFCKNESCKNEFCKNESCKNES